MDIQKNYQAAVEAVKKAQNPVLIAHRKPDGDSIGAALALHFLFRQFGKKTVLACVDTPSNRFSFLPDLDKFQKNFSYHNHDLIVVSDAGDRKMSGFHEIIPEFLSNRVPILNVDHHVSNDLYGAVNLIDVLSASTTVIVYKLAELLEARITRETALCLLTGIYNDTGSFMHANTNLEAFRIAGELMKTGVDVSVISKAMFRNKPMSQLKVWGVILERLKRNRRNVVSSIVTLNDIHKIGATSEDTGGIIDLINTVSDADFTMVLAEDEKGFVKGSFRTQKNDVDVARIAAQFGGGGHKKASGFRILGRLKQEMIWKIVPQDPSQNEQIVDPVNG